MSATMKPDLAAHSASSADHVVNVRDLIKYFPVRDGVLQRVAGHVEAVTASASTSTGVRPSVWLVRVAAAKRLSAAASLA
jgi:hypothetical protein